MENRFGYEGKRVVVTGAASGMGEATAEVVGGLGAEIVAVDVREPTVDCATYLEVDLRERQAMDEAVDSIVAGGPVNALFNCAGLPGQTDFPATDVMLVNFLAMRHLAESFASHMQRDDAIASVSSAGGIWYRDNIATIDDLLSNDDYDTARQWIFDHPDEVADGYMLSKMTTIVWTMRRAVSLATDAGIRLNCISPGPTRTAMLPHFVRAQGQEFMDSFPKPLGRYSESEDQAWPLAFLCSDAACYVAGVNLYTDAGFAGGYETGVIGIEDMMPAGMAEAFLGGDDG